MVRCNVLVLRRAVSDCVRLAKRSQAGVRKRRACWMCDDWQRNRTCCVWRSACFAIHCRVHLVRSGSHRAAIWFEGGLANEPSRLRVVFCDRCHLFDWWAVCGESRRALTAVRWRFQRACFVSGCRRVLLSRLPVSILAASVWRCDRIGFGFASLGRDAGARCGVRRSSCSKTVSIAKD